MVDTDAIIVRREGRAISDIFATDGEGYFRALETQVAKELGCGENLIIATGGGLPMREENVAALRQNGLIFWLKRDPADTFSSESMDGRPLAQAGKADFVARFEARAPVYAAAADYIIEDFSSPEATVESILSCLT